MDRPPPYFPQNSLSPRDDKRYLKFKILVGVLIALAVLIGAGAIVGIYYLSAWLLG
jgi:hypothetical protein